MPIKEGPLLGKVNKGGRFVGAGMSAPSIYAVVVEYAERLGVEFRPHDLRRYAESRTMPNQVGDLLGC
jgi:integrase